MRMQRKQPAALRPTVLGSWWRYAGPLKPKWTPSSQHPFSSPLHSCTVRVEDKHAMVVFLAVFPGLHPALLEASWIGSKLGCSCWD